MADDSPLSPAECGCFRVDRDWYTTRFSLHLHTLWTVDDDEGLESDTDLCAGLCLVRWLFRYVLAFLRDGVLPQDPKLLRELYLESEFWKLESLRRAIEMRNMELLQRKQASDAMMAASLGDSRSGALAPATMKASSFLGRLKREATPGPVAARDPSAWWLEPPVWWGQGGVSAEKKADNAPEPPAKVSAFASLLKKKAKRDAEPGTTSEQDAWWKSATYKGVDYAQSLSPEKKKAPADGRHEDSATPRVPLIINSTWASANHLTQ